jgi:hypothetical protein
MTNYSARSTRSSDGEVPGARAFYAAVVIGVAMLLLGAVWQVAPHEAGSQANAATQHAEIVQASGGSTAG